MSGTQEPLSRQRVGRLRVGLANSLRLRVLALVVVAIAIVAVPAGLIFTSMVETAVVRLGLLFSEKQVLYDRYRGLEALTREIGLAETLSRSPTLKEWSQDEYNPVKKARGLAELDYFRQAFREQSYFFVVDKTGNYYFNDRDNTYGATPLRYRLDRSNPSDAWYDKTAALGDGCHLNVDRDRALDLTNVWINCVVRDGARTLGIVGTGIELTSFIRDVVETTQPGVETFFVDGSGAVQAALDPRRIDFRSVTKALADRKTVFQLVDGDEDRATLATMMAGAVGNTKAATSHVLSVGGRQMLVGVGYLDKLGWYNVTVMDLDAIIDRSLFLPIGLLLATVAVGVAVALTWLFKRSVLDRLKRAERALERIETGDFDVVEADPGKDEIGRLAAALRRMARAVRDNTETLEQTVRERTDELRRIAFRDPMTGVLNRRGFVEAHAALEGEAKRSDFGLGLILLDIDRFKTINDTHGHAAGDKVIRDVADRLTGVIRDGDLCGRWGGDEFIVVIADCRGETLKDMAKRVLEAVRDRPIALPGDGTLRISTSMGAHLISHGEPFDVAAGRADLALYAAKRGGRNRVVVYDRTHHGDTMDGAKVA